MKVKAERIVMPACLMMLACSMSMAQPESAMRGPTLTVTGRGEADAAPDRAAVRIGAVAQAEQADEAQSQVSQIVQRAVQRVAAIGIEQEAIQTASISLSPVYSESRPDPKGQPQEPRIVGYRASNSLRVEVKQMQKIGAVIDAAVEAGANQIEGISFHLSDDTAPRQEALRQAAQQARQKAQALADALDVRIEAIERIEEGGGQVTPPRPEFARAALAAEAATPVQPGLVRVEAHVTVSYRIAPARKQP